VTVRRSLGAVKAAGREHGGTVNDVVLAAVAGGLRALVSARHEDPDRPFRVLVPVSLRHADEHGDLGNRTGALFVELPCWLEGAVERLEWIAPHTAAQKASGLAEMTEAVLGGTDVLPPAVDRLLGEAVLHQPFVNLVVTNVPGPPQRMYIGGAALLDVVPIVPLSGNLSIGVAIISYDGMLTVGVDAAAETVPDIDIFIAGLEHSFDELNVRVRQPIVT
jgi:WS/DGAT/MGAT family acyltransferase